MCTSHGMAAATCFNFYRRTIDFYTFFCPRKIVSGYFQICGKLIHFFIFWVIFVAAKTTGMEWIMYYCYQFWCQTFDVLPNWLRYSNYFYVNLKVPIKTTNYLHADSISNTFLIPYIQEHSQYHESTQLFTFAVF